MTCCPNCGHTFQTETRQIAGITERQRDLLIFIKSYLSENGGVAPTHNEMAHALGLSSKSGINRLVCGLEERGFIQRLKDKSRSISIVREAA